MAVAPAAGVPLPTDWQCSHTVIDLIHEQLYEKELQVAQNVHQRNPEKVLVNQAVRCCALAQVEENECKRTVVVLCVNSEVRVYRMSLISSDGANSLLWKAAPFVSLQVEKSPSSSFYEKSYGSVNENGVDLESSFITCCSVSPPTPSLRLAVGSTSGRIAIYDALTGIILNDLKQVSSRVDHLSFCPTYPLPDTAISTPLNKSKSFKRSDSSKSTTNSPMLSPSRPTSPPLPETPQSWESMLLCGYGEGTCRLYAFPGPKLLSEFHATLPDDNENKSKPLKPEVLALFSEDIRELLSSQSSIRPRVPLVQAAWSHDANLIALAPEVDSVEIHKVASLVALKPEDLADRRKFRPRKRLPLPCWPADISFAPQLSQSSGGDSSSNSLPPLFVVLDIAGNLHGFDTRSWDLVLHLIGGCKPYGTLLHASSPTSEPQGFVGGGGNSDVADNGRIGGNGSSGVAIEWLGPSRLALSMREENSIKVLDIIPKDTYTNSLFSASLAIEEATNSTFDDDEKKMISLAANSAEHWKARELLVATENIVDKVIREEICQLQETETNGSTKKDNLTRKVPLLSLLPPLASHPASLDLPIIATVAGLHSLSKHGGVEKMASLPTNTCSQVQEGRSVLLAVTCDHRALLLHIEASIHPPHTKADQTAHLPPSPPAAATSSDTEVGSIINENGINSHSSNGVKESIICTQLTGVIAFPLGRFERWRRSNVNNWREAHRITHVVVSEPIVKNAKYGNKEFIDKTFVMSPLNDSQERDQMRRNGRVAYHCINGRVMAVSGVGGSEINIWSLPHAFGISDLSSLVIKQADKGIEEQSVSLLRRGGSYRESEWKCCYANHESTITCLSIAPHDLPRGLFCSGDSKGWVHVWVLSGKKEGEGIDGYDGDSDDEEGDSIGVSSPLNGDGGSVVRGVEKYNKSEVCGHMEAILVAKWKHHEGAVVSVEFTRAVDSQLSKKAKKINPSSKNNQNKTSQQSKALHHQTYSKGAYCNYGLLCDMFEKSHSPRINEMVGLNSDDSGKLPACDLNGVELFQVVSCDSSGNVVTVEVPTLANKFNQFQINEATGGWLSPRNCAVPNTLVTVCSLAKAIVSWKLGDSAITVLCQLPNTQKGMVSHLSVRSLESDYLLEHLVEETSTERSSQESKSISKLNNVKNKSSSESKRGMEKTAHSSTTGSFIDQRQQENEFEVGWCSSKGGVWLWKGKEGTPRNILPEQVETAQSPPIVSTNTFGDGTDVSTEEKSIVYNDGIFLSRNWIAVWGGSSVLLFSREIVKSQQTNTPTSAEMELGSVYIEVIKQARQYNLTERDDSRIISARVDMGKLHVVTASGWAVCFEVLI